ncbi:hypothetical protein SAMN06295912_112112 [Sphingomonas laterariae]|uniref:Uncharacterized protein n=1 Tax=Edaphosphingomonas laterariae TaxID=861865 RepID=A0A239GJW4_9SPHN|nr:hypothetical protein [Sphingomonas laterariae]SNS69430.1 hypothetical protein SAMN06295912_112112 [Sphingomonas laterariae]
MSTLALLIVSASLRFHRRSGRFERPSPSEALTGQGWTSTFDTRNSGAVPEVIAARSLMGPRRHMAASETGGAGQRQRPLMPFMILRPWPWRLPRRAEAASPSVARLRGRVSLACFALILSVAGAGSAAQAQERSPATQPRAPDIVLPPVTVEAELGSSASTATQSGRIGGPAPGPCVTVDIAGHRAGHLECATDRLQAAAETAQAQTRSAIETPVIGAGSPDVQTGVANQTATRQRMGNTFGTSVHPQRPNRPVYQPRGGTP